MERSVVNKLTKKQRTFLAEYLKHGNATKAAETAGYAWPDKVGSQLKQHPSIQSAINEFFHEQEMSAAEVVARLSEQGRAAYAPYINPDGSVDLQRLIKEGKAHLIKILRPTQHGLTVEFYDAQSALVQVGRYHGLFTDRVKFEDWQDEIVDLLRRGEITPDDVRAAYPDLAAQFFAKAGIKADATNSDD